VGLGIDVSRSIIKQYREVFGRFLFRPLVISNGFLGLLNPFDKNIGLCGKIIPWQITVFPNLRF
jgi:hypothetical protein